MALNPDQLGQAIATKVQQFSQVQTLDPIEFWKVVSTEIINHIQNNAQVTVTGTGNQGAPVNSQGRIQ